MIRWGCYSKKHLVGRERSGYPDGAEVESVVKSGARAGYGHNGYGCGLQGLCEELLVAQEHLRLEGMRWGRERPCTGGKRRN